MRIATLLISSYLAFLATAQAQSVPVIRSAAPKQKFRSKPEVSLETGLVIPFTPAYVFKNGTVQVPERHTGSGTEILLKLGLRPQKAFHLGVRAGMTVLRVFNDGVYTYANHTSVPVAVKYATPLVQIGLQAHYDLPLTQKLVFRVSPFAGYGYAWADRVEVIDNAVTALPVGNSKGFNAGVDVTVRIAFRDRLDFLVSTGYQRSWMREAINNSGTGLLYGGDEGFNISHIPLGIGVSTRLRYR